MTNFIYLVVKVLIAVVLLLLGYLMTQKYISSSKNKFLKGPSVKKNCKISQKDYISHDTIKLTLDLPDISTELGLPLGNIHIINKLIFKGSMFIFTGLTKTDSLLKDLTLLLVELMKQGWLNLL